MKASEARALTAQYVTSANVDALYTKLRERIRAAAQQGQTSITRPFSGLLSESFMLPLDPAQSSRPRFASVLQQMAIEWKIILIPILVIRTVAPTPK